MLKLIDETQKGSLGALEAQEHRGILIRRRYEPQLSALEDLVEFLHRFLMEDPCLA